MSGTQANELKASIKIEPPQYKTLYINMDATNYNFTGVVSSFKYIVVRTGGKEYIYTAKQVVALLDKIAKDGNRWLTN